MLPTDVATLKDRLAELAEVFERKNPTEKALKVWFDVLREFQVQTVAGVLIGWPKIHGKFPTPAEVWKVTNDIATAERERKAQAENKREFYPGVGGAQAEHFIAEMRKVLALPKWTPREHWEHVLKTAKPGSIGHRYATDALKKIGARSVQREPGQDDEEKAA